jgi:hypothetical protein
MNYAVVFLSGLVGGFLIGFAFALKALEER